MHGRMGHMEVEGIRRRIRKLREHGERDEREG